MQFIFFLLECGLFCLSAFIVSSLKSRNTIRQKDCSVQTLFHHVSTVHFEQTVHSVYIVHLEDIIHFACIVNTPILFAGKNLFSCEDTFSITNMAENKSIIIYAFKVVDTGSKNAWIFDSGVTDRMTFASQYFLKSISPSCISNIIVADGSSYSNWWLCRHWYSIF